MKTLRDPKRKPTHPGEMLREDVLPALNMTQAEFAKRLADWDFTGVELRPPTRLVDDRLTLDVGGLRVDLIYVGPAHTQGDLLVHLPEQRIVFTGDVLFRLCTPIGWEGTFQRWGEALDKPSTSKQRRR